MISTESQYFSKMKRPKALGVATAGSRGTRLRGSVKTNSTATTRKTRPSTIAGAHWAAVIPASAAASSFSSIITKRNRTMIAPA